MGFDWESGDNGTPQRKSLGFSGNLWKACEGFSGFGKTLDSFRWFPVIFRSPLISHLSISQVFTQTYAGKLISYLGQRTFATKNIFYVQQCKMFSWYGIIDIVVLKIPSPEVG